jgi:hypothetical protein
MARSRALVIHNNGSDGTDVEMWCSGGPAALARGWYTLLFDGPGQQSMLFEHGVPFRPDCEAVLGPVLDAVVTRPEIDAERIAVIGVSQAGYWVARAAAFEKRIKAIVLDPGVDDVGASWFAHLPPYDGDAGRPGEPEGFRRVHEDGDGPRPRDACHLAVPDAALRYGVTVRGVPRGSCVHAHRSGRKNRMPQLVLEPEGEQFWPGQSQRLYDALRCPKHLVKFTSAEGGDLHCEPKTPMLRNQRVFDWLAETF